MKSAIAAAVATPMLTLLSAGAPSAGSPPVSLPPETNPVHLRHAGVPLGTVGNGRGVVNGYDRRPHLRLSPLGPWRFRISEAATSVPRDRERGLREG